MKNKIILIIVTVLFLIGFYLRLKGIQDNHSFWADEAFISATARDIVTGKVNLFDGFKTVNYQPLQLLVTFFSFELFGFTEFAARLPSVFIGTIGIIFAYLLGTQLSNKNGGLLSGFLYAFSQLNLANSTQAKPYTTIQTLLLIILYLLTIIDKVKNSLSIHLLIIALASAGTLFNYSGILLWIPYIIYIFSTYKNEIFVLIKKPTVIIGGIFIVLLLSIIFHLPDMLSRFINTSIFNNTTYLRELLWRNYAFITLPALVGIFTIYKKNKIIFISTLLYSISLLLLWNFKQYSHNIRYLVPFFGILFVFFGVFWSEVGDKILNKKSGFLCLIVVVVLFVGGYKIVRKPATFYSPNADLLGDVQIADYKSAFSFIHNSHIPSNIVIFNDIADAQVWYDKKLPDALFSKAYIMGLKPGQTLQYGETGKIIYTSLSQFKTEMKKYPKGILIVEDWESFLPEDIKQYAKKNLKLEYRVEGLPQAQGDNWPVAVYSWGL